MDDAAVPLATDDGPRGEHPIDDIRLADSGDMAGDAVPGGNLPSHAAGRAVDDHRPGRSREDIPHGEGERALLADVPAGGGGNGEPVGIGILKEPDRGTTGLDLRQPVGEVLGGRLGAVLEEAVGSPPRDDDLASEGLQKRQADAAARAVATVEPDLEPAPADPLDIDGGEDEPDVRRRAVDLAARAGGGSGSAGGVAGMEALEDRPAGGGGEHAALGREELEPVVGGGIVAGGDL